MKFAPKIKFSGMRCYKLLKRYCIDIIKVSGAAIVTYLVILINVFTIIHMTGRQR